MQKRILIFGLTLLFSVILLTCSGQSSGEQESAEEVVAVEIIQAHSETVHRTLELLGNVEAISQVRLFSTIPDRITRFAADMGDTVQVGSLIAVIENESIQSRVNQVAANLAQAQSQLANLENEFARMKRLYEENAVSQQQYDGTKTQLEATQAQVRGLKEALKQARTQMENSFIRSPLNGLVGQRFQDVGDMANPQMPVATVVQMDTVKVSVNIIERNIRDISLGLDTEMKVR